MQGIFSDPHASFSQPWPCAGMPGHVCPSLGPWAGPWALGRALGRARPGPGPKICEGRAGPGKFRVLGWAGPGPGPPARPKAQNPAQGPRLGQTRHASTCPGLRKRSMGVRKSALHGVPQKKRATRKIGVTRPFKAAFFWGHTWPKDRGAGRRGVQETSAQTIHPCRG